MRLLALLGVTLIFCTGCHHTNRGGPAGFGLLGSNPGNGVATAPPVYAQPPQYVAVPQPAAVAPVAAAPVAAAPQIVAAPQPIIMQAAPIAAPTQVVQQQPAVVPTSYYQSNACQPCPPVCQPAACCTPCQ